MPTWKRLREAWDGFLYRAYHFNRLRQPRLLLAEVDADHWKTWVHQRLVTPLDQPGALTLFQAPPQTHLSLAKHLTAERKTEEFITGKGVVTKWERLRKSNHWLDAIYNTSAAAHHVGVRLIDQQQPTLQPRQYGKLSYFDEQKRSKRPLQIDTERYREMTQRWWS